MEKFAIKTNTGITNYNGGELFFCYKIQSGDCTFYRTIENNLNRHYITFNIKEITEINKVDIKF
jgi:hypothetical protein